MEVANVVEIQSTPKSSKATNVSPEEFSKVLSETIDLEETLIVTDEKDEEKPNQLLEMMMGYLSLNVQNENPNELAVIQDTLVEHLNFVGGEMEDTIVVQSNFVDAEIKDTMVSQSNFSDTENLVKEIMDREFQVNGESSVNKAPNNTIATEELSKGFLQGIEKFENTDQSNLNFTNMLPGLAEESLLVESDAKEISSDLDLKAFELGQRVVQADNITMAKNTEKVVQRDTILEDVEKPDNIVQHIKGIENAVETKENSSEFLNKTFEIEKNSNSLEGKTNDKIEITEGEGYLNSIDNPHLKATNSINKPTVEISDVKLSNGNTQKVNDTIIQLVETTKEGDTSLLKVKLYPENFGTVDVSVKMEKGKLTANILVDNDQIKGIFNKSINELSESLLKQNIQVEKINIDLKLDTNPSTMNQSFNNGQQEGFNKNQSNMRNRSLGHYYQNTEPLVPAEADIYDTGK
ncbi:MAG: flagellar hook-length control protein FliK, partial [Tissierellia bacterium]|nr:flagellar hook-length control protein FliK [Tissierellia bacterium]